MVKIDSFTYNVEHCRINVVYFNDNINVRQRRNNVVIFNVEFHNIDQRRNNVVNMTICKKLKRAEKISSVYKKKKGEKKIKIYYTELEV